MAGKKSNTDKGTSSRCFASERQLVVGGVAVEVNFFPPRRSTNDMKLESSCPACYAADQAAEPIKTEVFHHCGRGIAGHGPFKYADLVRATKDDDGVMQVIGSVEEVNAVKGVNDDPDLEEDEDLSFHLIGHLAEKIEASTYPLGTPYILRPVPGKPNWLFPFLFEKIGHDGRYKVGTGKTAKVMVLVGHVVLKGNRKFMMIRTWNGQLVAQELLRPEDVHEFAPIEIVKNPKFAKLVDDSLELIEEEFDPANYENETRKRMAEFRDARLADSTATIIPMPTRVAAVPAELDEDAMLLALTASVAAAKAAKAEKAAS